MMWECDKSNIFTNKCNEEISYFYTNLWKNQEMFDKFVSYIKKVQNNFGKKQCCFDFIAGLDTSFVIFNSEIERLNSHVASTVSSLRRFSQLKEGNQANSEWNELSKQICALIELLNQFLINKSNLTNNFATTNKCNQYICEPETSKINTFTQTERNSSFLRRTSNSTDECIESDLLDLAILEEEYCAGLNLHTPLVNGPIRRKRTRHSTGCCSCGKPKYVNKSTQTKNRHNKSGCCFCRCKCCKNDSKYKKTENDDACWVTLYEVQTQTNGNEPCPPTKFHRNEMAEEGLHHFNDPICSVAENVIGLTVPLAANKPTLSSISPTPYGVSSNSLPIDDKNTHVPMECNIKLLLKLLQEIEKSLNVVKLLHDSLLQQTGHEPSLNHPEPKNNDINLHLTITLENNLAENGPHIEFNQIPNNRKSNESIISSGRRLSSFFKRKNGNLCKSVCNPQGSYVKQQNIAENDRNKSDLEKSQDEVTRSCISNSKEKISLTDHNTCNNESHIKSVPRGVNIDSNKYNITPTPCSNRRSSFKQSLYEDDPNFTKSLLNHTPSSHRAQKNLHGDDTELKTLHNTDENLCKSFEGKVRKRHSLNPIVYDNNPGTNTNRRRSVNQRADNKRSSLSENESDRKYLGICNNNKKSYFDCNVSKDHTDTELNPLESDEIPKKSVTIQENNPKSCSCCENNHALKHKSFNKNFDSFRCPMCQHRCVYCKSCFEMHESLYNCLKNTKDAIPDGIKSTNTNTRNDKNFWAETMLYFMPNFLATMRKGSNSDNLEIPNQNLFHPMPNVHLSTPLNIKNNVTSEASSPECIHGTREINLINDTDIPENSYLTASK